MITKTLESDSSSDIQTTAGNMSALRLSSHFDINGDEPVRFLKSVVAASRNSSPTDFHGPTPQDLECLRQAAWKFSRQTATPTVSGEDVAEVLVRLGYM